MAQVLKKEINNKILKSAKHEFFIHGYEKSSLRKIAKNANITVGNLYRYYESKEKIYEAVVSESYVKLNNIIEKHTFNNFKLNSFPTLDSISEVSKKITFKEIVQNIMNDVIETFESDFTSLLILLKDENTDSKLNLQNWFFSIFELQYKELNISKYLASSFTEGILRITINEKDLSILNEKVQNFISFYFEKGGNLSE